MNEMDDLQVFQWLLNKQWKMSEIQHLACG